MTRKFINATVFFVFFICLSGSAFAQKEKMHSGKFNANWESLSQYQTPEWFRDAKFGIWAHWGPQCQPEQGDWYARFMYDEGSRQNKWHVQNYGHPSVFGFKDVINEWKADAWDPEKLVALYKNAGARYFFAMGNHHDNLDLWNSKYQKWNSTNVGPKKDILQGWSKAARNNGLPFGVSIHSSHAWTWYETAQRADKQGNYAGVPYDGKLTADSGKGKWWQGLDPQELYAQNHPLSQNSDKTNTIHSQWKWQNGAALPTEAYCTNFYNRTVDMINQFNPDLIYFDDDALPLWPASNVGLEIAAHYYNQNMAQHKGKLNAVIFGKILSEKEKECLVWDVERGAPDKIQDKPWQTCTCIGDWHYNRSVYNNNRYKSAKQVVQMLADVVSKNGNLLLNVPVRGDGSIDEKEQKIVEQIGEWMKLNSEAIYSTRPWVAFGEGPIAEKAIPISAQGFNEGKAGTYTAQDIRFTQKKNMLYAIVMAPPANNEIVIRSLSSQNPAAKKYRRVKVFGFDKTKWAFQKDGLHITLPHAPEGDMPIAVKLY